ncbi:DUF4245 domain-containing protein [Leifsonia poae]|uniref:DUF4245 domain-containing protein n=1 Tax=Leifsonia poae TaxID=110933 RepID=A0A9W6H6E1_9MICO|nr:DUF4245 domain-containing protein [Leifsonia poae]GLJ74500.1 hypothetical protein GCM10017584_00730 [Leifsonia poae]
MTPRTKPPAVVAELGRPETPEETAARKAENSANHRNRQTVNNLVFSLLATVGLVIIIVLAVPRGTPVDVSAPVPYQSIAAEAQGSEPDRLLVPDLPSPWKSNNAELRTKTPDNVDSWYIGLLTPKKQFIGITQGFDANDTWVASQVNKTMIKGTTTIDGVTWDVYDNRDSGNDNGNVDFAYVTHAGKSSIIVFGSAENDEFHTVASALAPQIRQLGGS